MAWWNRNSLTASVSIVPTTQRTGPLLKRSRDARWQLRAWQMFHELGEVRFFAWYHGNALSRIRYYVGTRERPGGPITQIPDDASPDDLKMRDALLRVRGRDGLFSSLAGSYGVHRCVAGECFLVGEEGIEGERWRILSTTEMRALGEKRFARINDDGSESPILDSGGVILRLYTSDPEHSDRADSPLRPVLDVCEALQTAQAMQTAGDKLRLATAGLFLVPAEADLPKAPVTDNSGGPAQPERLMLLDNLLAVMSAALEEPGSAGSLVPIMVEVSERYIEKFKRITFDSATDDTLVARIDHLIRRLAQGLDLPIEKLLGSGDASHWAVWSISEEAIGAHIAPAAAAFTIDLTVGLLHPIAKLMGIADPDRYAIGFDTSDLIVSPNEADQMFQLYDRNLLAGEHLLVFFGYDPTQVPDIEETIRNIRITRASNPTNPDPEIDIAILEGKPPPPPRDAAPTGSPEAQPDGPREIPVDSQEKRDAKRQGPPKDGPPKGETPGPSSGREGVGRGKKGGRGIVKKAVIDEMVTACLTDLDPEILRRNLAELSDCPECAEKIMEGLALALPKMVDGVVSRRVAEILCEAAMFDLVGAET